MKGERSLENPQTGVGLVLEGGAMRGLFTAGVLDVLMEQGIFFPAMVGVSAGAAFGCNYKSGQIGRVLRYNLNYCKDPRYCGVRSLIKTGDLFGADFCYRELPQVLDPFDDDAFAASATDFFVVSTDVATGKPVYTKCNEVNARTYDWMRASASMPLASRPVNINGRTYLDGGISDSIPLDFMRAEGYARNVVVLTQPRNYVKEKNRALPMMKLGLRKYPKLIEAMANRHINYNESRNSVFSGEKAGEVFVLCPDEALNIHRVDHDPRRIRAAYDAGREVALRRLPELKEFLDDKQGSVDAH